MKAGNGKHFEQAYNAQLAVDTEGSYLILGQRVTTQPREKEGHTSVIQFGPN